MNSKPLFICQHDNIWRKAEKPGHALSFLESACRHHDTVCRVVAHWQDHTDGRGQSQKGGISSDVVFVNTNQPFDESPRCSRSWRGEKIPTASVCGRPRRSRGHAAQLDAGPPTFRGDELICNTGEKSTGV